MPFRCPNCASPSTLEVTHAIELPPDSRSDEITLQALRCSACGFRALAVYEESRRGAPDHEAWDHTGYAVGANDLEKTTQVMETCPDPRNPICACPAHHAMGKQDRLGRWAGMADLVVQYSFRMELAWL